MDEEHLKVARQAYLELRKRLSKNAGLAVPDNSNEIDIQPLIDMIEKDLFKVRNEIIDTMYEIRTDIIQEITQCANLEIERIKKTAETVKHLDGSTECLERCENFKNSSQPSRIHMERIHDKYYTTQRTLSDVEGE